MSKKVPSQSELESWVARIKSEKAKGVSPVEAIEIMRKLVVEREAGDMDASMRSSDEKPEGFPPKSKP